MTPTITPFETSNVKGLFVEVPEGVWDFLVNKGYIRDYISWNDGQKRITDSSIGLPQGNWQLLGKLSEITEDQAKEIVEMGEHPADGRNAYLHYGEPNDYLCAYALPSFFTLMRSLNIPDLNNIVVLIEKK